MWIAKCQLLVKQYYCCTASCELPRFQVLHMVYFIQNVQKYRRYKLEIYVKISTGTTISQEILKQTVNKNNIHVLVGVSQVSQIVVVILLINDCYVMSLVVIISRMNFVLYRNNCLPSITKNKIEQVFESHNRN